MDRTHVTTATATFAAASDEYARARPRYPDALFRWLADSCPRRDDVWDCATGNGQAAVGLAPYFSRVTATDLSAEQLAQALPADHVRYAVSSAEATPFADRTFDLIVVAQALHWFDHARFWPEVARVARRGALFCAWGYDWPETTPAVDTTLIAPLREIIAPFWASEARLLWNGYRPADVAFPFAPLAAPSFAIEAVWSQADLLAYLRT